MNKSTSTKGKKAVFWTSEKLLSLAAILISLCTLFVFIYQTSFIRKQQFMSVYPCLILANAHSGSLEYEYILKNDGVGPAIIKSLQIEDLSGNLYESINDYLETKLSVTDSISIFNTDIFEGQIVPANEKIPLYGLFDKVQTDLQGLPKNTILGANKLRSILNSDSLKIKITYESIYGERWTIRSGQNKPEKKKTN